MNRGRFITVEGLEGVGKSTTIDALAGEIEAAGYTVVRTREPGGTPTAERIRRVVLDHGDEPIPALAEALLMFASRSIHVSNCILPALERGSWVICDRFTDTSRAYQGTGRGLDPAVIEQLADWTHGNLQPDLTVLLDAPIAIGRERAGQRGGLDRIEAEELAFFERARARYLELAAAEPRRWTVIDATRSLQQVRAELAAVATRLLESNGHEEYTVSD